MNMTLLDRTIIGQQPDCIDILYDDEPLLCVGTYEMSRHNNIETRAGSISLYDTNLLLKCKVDQKAILDLKVKENVIITSQSDSIVSLHKKTTSAKVDCWTEASNLDRSVQWKDETSSSPCLSTKLSSQARLDNVAHWKDETSSSPCLSVTSIDRTVFTTRSDGYIVCLFGFLDGKKEESKFKGHDYEIWTSYASEETELMYTGNSDGSLKVWDLNTLKEIENIKLSSCICSILEDGNYILTGCYDNKLRICDRRMGNKCLNEYKKNSGIWRINKMKNRKDCYILACIEDGVDIFDINNNNSVFSDVTETVCYGVCEYNSFLYGIDFYSKSIYKWDTSPI
eukprot:GHVP01017492.1.p1 GENE.GHVP01017492.1~~GHVP01017492.1.p1  ORF type:complete len:340 (+),score=42.23 GHVP01017492.1:130-1149(+)